MSGEDFDIEAFLLAEALEAAESQAAFQTPPESSDFNDYGLPSYYNLVWPKRAEIVSGWLDQTLYFGQGDNIPKTGLLQPINGPCGVLAVIHALLIANRLKREGVVNLEKSFSNEELAQAISEIILLQSPNQTEAEVILVLWKTFGREVNENVILKSGLFEAVLKNIAAFKDPGGICLLIYSVVATKGIEKLKKELFLNGGGPSLVEAIGADFKNIWFCSSDLMTLLLRGNADGNLGAYNELGQRVDFSADELSNFLPVGLLSLQERQTRIPVMDRLKNPPVPVWILHSGDHFTVFFQQNLKDAKNFYHFNGLPPGGPKLTKIIMEFSELAKPASKKLVQSDFIPIPGEIDDIVQVNIDDKKAFPKDFTKWQYEVILAVHDPSVSGTERPKEMRVELFKLGSKPRGNWRCANCYRGRHKTFCFGENKCENGVETTPEECKFCGMKKEKAQWTIWLPFSELPGRWKGSAAYHYGPKFYNLIATKWLDVHIVSPTIEEYPFV